MWKKLQKLWRLWRCREVKAAPSRLGTVNGMVMREVDRTSEIKRAPLSPSETLGDAMQTRLADYSASYYYYQYRLRPLPGTVTLDHEAMAFLLKPWVRQRAGGLALAKRTGIEHRTACRLLEVARDGLNAPRQRFALGTIFQLCLKLRVRPGAVISQAY